MVEYNRRHGTDSIWPCQAGLVFLDPAGEKDWPAIVLSSLQGQCNSSCNGCALAYTGVVIEIFLPSVKATDSFFAQASHDHVAPDINLLKFIKHKGLNVVPFHAKQNRDLETWLWRHFVRLRKESLEKDHAWIENKKWTENDYMAWMAINRDKSYDVFYKTCMNFLPGRKYVLLS
jgi:hypothetical protein